MNASAFDRLNGAMQYHLVNTLGFASLRPVQNQTIDAILDGDNCVVLAPTAGGKTEAALFPLLSQMDANAWTGPSVIYLSPIKALLNNQETRLQRYAGMLSRRAFKWHGDVSASLRRSFIRDPADILMTTPESLEVMMMSQKVPSRRLFQSIRAVVIDEVHAFAADDRGAHLTSLLERLTRFCGSDVQRIGLSATVGNPDEILRWLQGTSQRKGRLVNPPRVAGNPDVRLDYVASLENAAKVISQLNRGGKRLVFVDSRRRVEQLAEHLRTLGVNTFLTHSSLSADARHQAEQAFESGENCVIVATSTMELGIDVGDLDAVLQVDAPPSVASFLQRMGRTGRRSGTRQNATILCTKTEDLATAAALLQLWRSGYIESVAPERAAYHVLAQQMMALTVQEGGVALSDWWAWVSGAEAFNQVTEAGRVALLEKMLAEDILFLADGKLSLGQRGQRLYGHRNFEALYAVFQAPATLKVLWGPDELGTVDAFFMQGLPENPSFYLAGRAWQATSLDWERGLCHVVPAAAGRHLNWLGAPRFLSRTLSEAVRELLVSDSEGEEWTSRAKDELRAHRAFHAFLREGRLVLRCHADRMELHTFLGGRANNLLARLLQQRLGGEVAADSFVVTLKGDAAKSAVAVQQELAVLLAPGGITLVDAKRIAPLCARGRLTKFQPCLPEDLELDMMAHRLLEVPTGVDGSQVMTDVLKTG